MSAKKGLRNKFTVRLPADLHLCLRELSEETKESVNNLIVDALEGYVRKRMLEKCKAAEETVSAVA